MPLPIFGKSHTSPADVMKNLKEALVVIEKGDKKSDKAVEEVNKWLQMVKGIIYGQDGQDPQSEQDDLSPEYVVGILDVLSSYILKEKESLPSVVLMNGIVQYLEFLQKFGQICEPVTVHRKWSTNIYLIVKRILQNKPQYISEDLMRSTFEIVREAVEVVGTSWFEPDPTLLCLIAHLNTVQIRICLDTPDRIEIKDLITYCAIGEVCIRCVDDADFLDDDKATILAKAVKDTACYIIEFWGEAREQDVAIDSEVYLVIYRFVCVFLAIGGSQLLDTSLLNKCSSSLLEICQQAIINDDNSTAYLLLPHLNHLPKLTVDTIHIIVEFVMKQFPNGNWLDAVDDAIECIENLKFRVDWYSTQTLLTARLKLDNLPDKRLVNILNLM